MLGDNGNLLLGQPEPTGVSQRWVAEITYIRIVGEYFDYPATLTDRDWRQIIGWAFRMDMTENLVLAALCHPIEPDLELVNVNRRALMALSLHFGRHSFSAKTAV